MKVPFFDIKARNAPIRDELLRAIESVIDSGQLAGGRFVDGFEGDFAAFCGTRHAVGVGCGTAAIWLALEAAGVGHGDEVITVPMTFAATLEAICATGAKPVLADIDAATYTMDPAALERAITPRSKAVVPVHLFGQCADMDPIREIAEQHGLLVVEDAAQAHGADYRGKRAGSLGDAGCFSFYPSKNLGALGEAGAVVTDDERIARRVRMLRDHGQSRKNHHEVIGWNSRMDGIQAAALRIKLGRLDRENQQRRGHAAEYDRLLGGLAGLVLPVCADRGGHVHHLYAVRVAGRDRFVDALGREGVECGSHYPVPVHLQPAFASLGCRAGDFPVAERCAGEFVSLPMYPELSSDQISHVAAVARGAIGACAAA